MDDRDGLDRAAARGALRGDSEIVRAYGEAHPETWVGMRFDTEPTVRIVAIFAGDVTNHDRELRPRVAHPGRLGWSRVPTRMPTCRR